MRRDAPLFLCVLMSVTAACGESQVASDAAVPPGVDGSVPLPIRAPHLPPVPANRLRVVVGPAPVRPLEGALLRAESTTGRVLDAVTDASGTAALALSPNEGPWSLTAAQRGLAAVSIVGLSELPDGDIRLDPVIDFAKGGGVPLQGSVIGASPGATVIVDAFNIDIVSLRARESAFETSYYNEFPTLPLTVTAMEVIAGRATRITRSPTLGRTGTAVSGVALDLSEAPYGFRAVRVPVTVPERSITSEAVRAFAPSLVSQIDRPHERTTVGVGVGREVFTGPDSAVEFDVAEGDFKPDYAVIRVDAARVRTNLFVHTFDGAERFTLPTFNTLEAVGSSLGDIAVRSDARDVDAIALHLGEDESRVPRWRCFFLPGTTRGTARLPTLPGDLTPADLGLSAPSISYGVMAIWMYSGRPWTTPVSNAAVLGYHTTVTTNYARIAGTWR